jgi:hypothetical protein
VIKVRLAGVACMIAGVCLCAAYVLFWRFVPVDDAERAEQRPAVLVTGVLWMLGHVALAPSLIGIYARQFRRAGLLGGTGLVLCVAGTLGLAAFAYRLFPELFDARVYRYSEMQWALLLQAVAELSGTSLLIGLLFFGVASVRARTYPRLAGALFAAAALVAVLALEDEGFLALAATVLAAGLVWLGGILLRSRPEGRQATRHAASARPASRLWTAD